MRLIDADKFILWLMDAPLLSVDEDIILDLVDSIETLVDSIKTVDAVPVVRCRDCKYYKEFRTKRNNQIMRLCYRMGKYDMEYFVNPNDFCSYGDRKEGADNG